jgi:hypothetical protein
MRPPFVSTRICIEEFAVVHIALLKHHRDCYSQAPSVVHSQMCPVEVHTRITVSILRGSSQHI